MRYPPIYHAPDDGDDPQGGESPKRPRPSDLAAQYHNDAMRVSERLAEVLDDNYKLREKNRTLTADLAAVKGKVPADGALVLSKDDAARWEAYTALGQPDALKQQIDGAAEAQTQLDTLRRGELLRTAGEATGYKPAVLAKLPSLAGKQIEARDVDGKPAYFVDGVALPEFIAQHDPEFLPALTAEAAKPAGTQFVRQSAGDPAKPVTAGQAYLNKTYKQGAS